MREYYMGDPISVRSLAAQFGVSSASVWRAIAAGGKGAD